MGKCRVPNISVGFCPVSCPFFFFNDTATTENYTLSLHDALPIYKDPSTGWHTISAYSSSNTALWNADYQSGGYMFEVDIRPVGSSAAWVAYYDLPFTLSGCGAPSLTPDLTTPQSQSTTVHFSSGV